MDRRLEITISKTAKLDVFSCAAVVNIYEKWITDKETSTK